jgi:hypothetical protein
VLASEKTVRVLSIGRLLHSKTKISINAAAAVASLPSEKQVAAVSGGKKELRQVAIQVREAKLPPKPEPLPPPSDATPDQLEIYRLTQQLTKLTEERDQLKKKGLYAF